MANDVRIIDHSGSKKGVHVYESFKDDKAGAVVYTRTLDDYIPVFVGITNDTYGSAMNQNAAFGGTPVGIHNGGDTTWWTGSNISGVNVDFASTVRFRTGAAAVEVNNPALTDTWQFAKGSPQALSGYTALSMFINIDKDWSAGDSVSIYGWDGGVVGTPVLLENYMDANSFDNWQSVIIPLEDLGLTTSTIDSFRMQQVGRAGKAGLFYIDDFQIEETGGGIPYTVQASAGKNFLIEAVRLTMVNDITGTATRQYDNFFGVSLPNGINIERTSDGVQVIGRSLSTIYDFYALGYDKVLLEEGATQSILAIQIEFQEPVLLRSSENDLLTLRINDDLSGMLEMSATAIGRTTR